MHGLAPATAVPTIELLDDDRVEEDLLGFLDACTVGALAHIGRPTKRSRLGLEVLAAPPEEQLAKLQKLDPLIREEDYYLPGAGTGDGLWDRSALAQDLLLTESFGAEALEEDLCPIREKVRQQQAERRSLPSAGLTELEPGVLFLGNREAALDVPALRRAGIQRIVNCSPQTVRTGEPFYRRDGIAYMELWEDDWTDYCVLQDFEAVWAFAAAGGPCLLHCEKGVNRSGALAVAMLMKIRSQRSPAPEPEEALRSAWSFVAARRPRLLENQSFQRQLLLFARLGFRWFPSVAKVWRKPEEHKVAEFREFAERVGRSWVSTADQVPPHRRWKAVIHIRDGVVRAEGELQKKSGQDAYNLSSGDAQRRAEQRIRSYAQRCLSKFIRDDAEPSPAEPVEVRLVVEVL